MCVCPCLCVCAHLHCLLHLQGLDGAKGDKVSLPFCLVEGIRRGFGYKWEEQMVISRDCFESHNPHRHPPAHSHAHRHTHGVHTDTHTPAGRHAERNIRGDERCAAARLRSFWGSERNEGEILLIAVFIRVPASNFH